MRNGFDAQLPRRSYAFIAAVKHPVSRMKTVPVKIVLGVETIIRPALIRDPGVDELAPIGEPPDPVDRVRRLVLLLQPFEERRRRLLRRHAVGRGLVVDLVADDRRIVFVMLGDLANHPLAIEAVGWIH